MMQIRIYNEEMNSLERTVEAAPYSLPFGTVRRLMNLVNIDKNGDTMAMLGVVAGAWNEIIHVLDTVFPGISEEEWDRTMAADVVRAIFEIAKYSFEEVMLVPVDEKN